MTSRSMATKAVPFKLFILLALTALACNISLRDDLDWFVAPDGNDRNTCLIAAQPCRTITEALERATDHDVIHLAAGTYHGEGYLTVENHITLQGAGRDASVINFNDRAGGIRVWGPYSLNLRDLTVSHAGDGGPGAVSDCIYVQQPAPSLSLENVKVTQCEFNGVTVYDPSSDIQVSVINSVINLNDRTGLDVHWGDLIVSGSIFSDNGHHGLHLYDVDFVMEGTTLERNRLTPLKLWSSRSRIVDATIRNNGSADSAFVEVLGDVIASSNAGIFVSGGLADIQASSITGNITGIFGANGTSEAVITVVDTQIENNHRGGIDLNSGQITLSNVVVAGNGDEEFTTFNKTGGIYSNRGSVSVHNSSIRGNFGGILIDERGTLLIDHSEVTHNAGLNDGGLTNNGETQITNSTFSQNEVLIDTGGRLVSAGIMNFGNLTMSNATISGNYGTGLMNAEPEFNDTTLSLSYVTIANNEVAGLEFRQIFDPAALTVSNTLIANNAYGDCLFDRPMVLSWEHVNIDTDGSCGIPFTASVPELALGPLRNNGGGSQTHALRSSSVAIDAASGSCTLTDQRDEPRPSHAEDCDVGAYENTLGADPTDQASQEATAIPQPDLSPTETDPATLILETDANCRSGDSTSYRVVTSFSTGESFPIDGRNASTTWFWILMPQGGHCWIAASTGVAAGRYQEVSIIALPTATATATITSPPEPSATPTCGPNDPNCP